MPPPSSMPPSGSRAFATTGGGRQLGQYLVTRSLITREQLDEALSHQTVHGARLGTNLVELGYLSIEQLAACLADFHKVPLPDRRWLEKPQRPATQRATRSLVERIRFIPMRLEGKVLHAAVLDPRHPSVLDDLRFATGCRIQPYVLPEIWMHDWLLQLFDLPRGIRHVDTRPSHSRAPSDPNAVTFGASGQAVRTPKATRSAPPRQNNSAQPPPFIPTMPDAPPFFESTAMAHAAATGAAVGAPARPIARLPPLPQHVGLGAMSVGAQPALAAAIAGIDASVPPPAPAVTATPATGRPSIDQTAWHSPTSARDRQAPIASAPVGLPAISAPTPPRGPSLPMLEPPPLADTERRAAAAPLAAPAPLFAADDSPLQAALLQAQEAQAQELQAQEVQAREAQATEGVSALAPEPEPAAALTSTTSTLPGEPSLPSPRSMTPAGLWRESMAPLSGAVPSRTPSAVAPRGCAAVGALALELARLESALLNSPDREQLIERALRIASAFATRVALFSVHQGMVQGLRCLAYDAPGTEPVLRPVEGVLVPLDAQSGLTDAARGEIVRADPNVRVVDQRVAQVLGDSSATVLLLPVTIKQRVVNVLYASGGDAVLGEIACAALQAVAAQMGAAYERLILARKTAGG